MVVTHALMCQPLTLSPMHEAMWLYTCHHAIRPFRLELHEIPTFSESSAIWPGNQISRDESNSEVRFVIQDLEKFQVCNLYYSDNLPFREKFQIYPGFHINVLYPNNKN